MQEQDGDTEPAHHARRPMNAFLIFCKRHRSVVREKYPNLENRSITKILGEWWANLDKEEKACYTGLAKQYKDAFFNANPDFKWYKLPAPPLRTLSSRPRDSHDKTNESPNTELYHDTEPEKMNNNSTKIDFNSKPSRDSAYETYPTLSMFTPGKLADEAQMGNLSRLLDTKTDNQSPNPFYSPFKLNAISTPNDYRSHNLIETNIAPSREDNIRELQNALTETTKVFEEDFDENKRIYNRYNSPDDRFTNQDMIDQIVDKRYYKEDEYNYQRNWSDDEKNSKSGRSCKGKRYQEFMAVGGLIVNKRQKRDFNDKISEENYNATCSWDPGSSRNEESSVTTDDSQQNISQTETSYESELKTDATDTSEIDNNASKTFKASDFDLDAKIAALPSLSLEKFQQKKRENKRKKKTINLKPKAFETSHIINSVISPVYDYRREMAENWRETVIGSQKRKPRKISITRLEINSLVSNSDVNEALKVSPEIKIATEAPCTVVQSMEICKQPTHDSVDLLALATLAEVASNTSKIDDTSMLSMDNFTAKANDGNASKV